MIKTNLCFKYALSSLLGACFLTYSPLGLSDDKLITNLEKSSGVSKDVEIENKKAPTPEAPPAAPVLSGSTKKIHTHMLTLGIGQVILYGDFSDLGEDGITADLYYTYKASHSFDFVANFHYFKQDTDTLSIEVPALALGIKGRFFQFDSFSPYGIVGLGFYAPKVDRSVNGAVVTSDDKVTLGDHFGIGMDLDLNDKITIGVIFHYHNPFDIKQDASKGGQVEGSYGKLLLTAGYTF